MNRIDGEEDEGFTYAVGGEDLADDVFACLTEGGVAKAEGVAHADDRAEGVVVDAGRRNSDADDGVFGAGGSCNLRSKMYVVVA